MSEASQPQTADEVLRCMGRNLLISQQIEALLKVLIENSEQVIEQGEGETSYRMQARSVKRWTLGQLAGSLANSVLSDRNSVELDTPISEPVVARLRFRITLDVSLLDSWRVELAKLIEERNELVHHFLPRWRPNCLIGIADALKWLNLQHLHLIEVRASVKSMLFNFDAACKTIAAQLDQPGLVHLLDPLVHALLDFLRVQAGADTRAWCSMSRAGQYLHQHHPQAMRALRSEGYKSFRAFVEVTGLFELNEFCTPGGGSALYLRVLQSTTGQMG